jgi:hypothetical protein
MHTIPPNRRSRKPDSRYRQLVRADVCLLMDAGMTDALAAKVIHVSPRTYGRIKQQVKAARAIRARAEIARRAAMS